MGLMQREKGKRYERLIANEFRKRWPDAVVRRSSQAERAYNSDVFIEGGPPVLVRLWLELQDARVPVPLTKLGQAERDCSSIVKWRTAIGGLDAALFDGMTRLPVVIWHRLGERCSYATMRMWVLDAVRSNLHRVNESVVTMRLEDFLDTLQEWHGSEVGA